MQLLFVTLSIAAGLYYLAEIVEEFTATTSKVIQIMIFVVIGAFVGLMIFEDMPWSLTICGLLAQICHLFLLRTFPYLELLSPAFIGAVVLLFVNHYLSFSHFSEVYYPFSEILSFFTICQWLVPFSFFVSLSANEMVLPTVATGDQLPATGDNDVVTNYFNRKSKRYGLLSFFQYAKESALPERVKKGF